MVLAVLWINQLFSTMKTLRSFFLMTLLLSFCWVQDAYSQGRGNQKQKHGKVYHKQVSAGPKYKSRGGGPPPWAPAHGYRAKNHVFFPDYHLFYDARRGGYVYWQSGGWMFSPGLPSFMASVDLGRARLQLMGDIPLTKRPELYYSNYHSRFPARQMQINVNIPVIIR